VNDSLEQRSAIYALIGFCEGIIGGEFLPEETAAKLRQATNRVCIAFDAPLVGESKNEVKW
jgi:hypothetical protein